MVRLGALLRWWAQGMQLVCVWQDHARQSWPSSTPSKQATGHCSSNLPTLMARRQSAHALANDADGDIRQGCQHSTCNAKENARQSVPQPFLLFASGGQAQQVQDKRRLRN